MDKYMEYFTNYVTMNYDINNELIKKKYYHSLRVAKLMILLAKKMNLNDDDILLSFKIGLCHDLGRFHEANVNGIFDNSVFDHGAYSNKILYNDAFIKYMDISEHLLFRKAIYCHNKKELNNNLNNREMLFANMIRDIDKIDIIGQRVLGSELKIFNEANVNVLNNYLNNLNIDIKDIESKTDSAILYLSFIKDLVFEESFDLAIKGNYLSNLLEIIDVSSDKKDLFNNLINKIYERRGKVYVR